MDRLTSRTSYGAAYTKIPLNESRIIDNFGDEHWCFTGFIVDRLAEYEDAEEQGLLVRLPCKVGTEIFRLVKRHTGRGLGKHSGKEYVFIMRGKMLIDDAMNFGKTVFLTRDEAVAAMKGEA